MTTTIDFGKLEIHSMGSFLSGRHRTANNGTLGSKDRVDMRVLKTKGFLRPGEAIKGTLGWTRHGNPVGEATVIIDLREPAKPVMMLQFSFDGAPITQGITIEAVPCGFGGQRYYFRCPTTGRRCLVLARVGAVFASRQAHRLTYRSQSVGELDRLMDARDTARNRLEGRDGFPKPTGKMHERLWLKWIEAAEAYDRMFVTESVRRFGFVI